ncbi:MAG: glycine cleavage system protein GcvH [Burkholderia sp.]|nr:glycine cleavage system protein GcvH [Burkholderia sp.]
MSIIPINLKYTKEHKWVHPEGNSVMTVGITDYAQSKIGDIVFIDLPEIGKIVTSGEVIGVIESVKVASDIYSPISGKVIDINTSIIDMPDSVNSNPYKSWLFKIKITSNSSIDELLDSSFYKKFIE